MSREEYIRRSRFWNGSGCASKADWRIVADLMGYIDHGAALSGTIRENCSRIAPESLNVGSDRLEESGALSLVSTSMADFRMTARSSRRSGLLGIEGGPAAGRSS